MKVYIKQWMSKPPALSVVAVVNVGAFDGLSFRNMDKSENPTLSTNFRNMRVTEIFLHPAEDALCVYVEEVKDGKGNV